MAHGDVAGGFPSAQVTAAGGWVCFEDEAGAWLNGPVRRTWGKAGQTPVLRLSGKHNGKISMVAWVCFKDGEESRMIYAIKPSGGCTKKDFPRFLALLHRRLDGPVTVIWDNYSSHISKHVKQYAQQQDWLTIVQLPSYAPELNPVELLWAHAKEKIAERPHPGAQLRFTDLDGLRPLCHDASARFLCIGQPSLQRLPQRDGETA
ncbi:transposase [Streptomyces sp. V4I2]|uniref:transposase n=1 Tax=Streptomyces sp. V4I2 TaxID=3042280 RepID=UPI00278355A7|nr:transposase [Streptomyces sp. V4I2]MDQ1046347.1 transposase [Streptomyces sp. V4I2]